MNYHKVYTALVDGDKVPRKAKKSFLGKRINKSKLRKMISGIIVIPPETAYETSIIHPHPFCPHCGCQQTRSTGNLAGYPEHWEYFYCLRCDEVVGYIDNSPFIHALECKESGYNPVFG